MRVYLRRRPGFRNVRGGHVIELQRGINPLIHTPLSIDGVFGAQTEAALKLYQAKAGLQPTGMVDELTWQSATGKDLPSVFRRCLAITAAFEGHGYTFAAGNWDKAYLTWGVVGFTLKHGNLGKVIKTSASRHPGVIHDTIGLSKAEKLLYIVDASAAEKKDWGDSISVLPKKYRIRADWEDAFEMLGNLPEIRAIQDEIARTVYWARAVSDMQQFGKLTEADAALFFDTAVQNGGVNSTKAQSIQQALAANPGAAGRDRLNLIANAIADGSNPVFHDDVLSRRATIATGKGRVHGADYLIEDWSVDYAAIEDQDL